MMILYQIVCVVPSLVASGEPLAHHGNFYLFIYLIHYLQQISL